MLQRLGSKTQSVNAIPPSSQRDAGAKTKAARLLGRLGGKATALTRSLLIGPRKRRAIARKAALARWAKR